MNDQWSPMDSAPKDGTWIMLALSQKEMARAHWAQANGMIGWQTRWCMWLGEPLEWRHLDSEERVDLQDWNQDGDSETIWIGPETIFQCGRCGAEYLLEQTHDCPKKL